MKMHTIYPLWINDKGEFQSSGGSGDGEVKVQWQVRWHLGGLRANHRLPCGEAQKVEISKNQNYSYSSDY